MTQRIKHGMESVMLLVLALSLSACGLSGSAQTGEVLDETTDKPIEGAIVVAEWIGDVSANWAGSHSTCYHVATAVTDDDGEYRIPGWSMKKEDKREWHKNLTPRDVSITVYMAGHVMAEKSFTSGSYEEGTYYLKPFVGSASERFEYLLNELGTDCGSDTVSNQSLLELREQLYDEAISVAAAPKDKKRLWAFLLGIEKIKFGYEEAMRRHLERR